MLHIGCHLSASKGFVAMGEEAVSLNADTFAFFTRNPRGGSCKPIDQKDVDAFLKLSEENNFARLVAHAPYTMNCCAADEGLREYSKNIIIDDLKRMEYIPGNYYNFHPGSHVKQGSDAGIELISDTLSCVLYPEMTTTVLLETMAGKGTEVGRSFDEISKIISHTEEKLNSSTVPVDGQKGFKLGVCLDTCHVWDGGYDIVNNLDGVLEEFDAKIGLKRLKAVHLNDSMNGFNTHKDRHEKIGKGKIGLEALVNVINHPLLKDLPFILETPNEHEGYYEEIKLLRSLCSFS